MIPIIYDLAEAARASCFGETKAINRPSRREAD